MLHYCSPCMHGWMDKCWAFVAMQARVVLPAPKATRGERHAPAWGAFSTHCMHSQDEKQACESIPMAAGALVTAMRKAAQQCSTQHAACTLQPSAWRYVCVSESTTAWTGCVRVSPACVLLQPVKGYQPRAVAGHPSLCVHACACLCAMHSLSVHLVQRRVCGYQRLRRVWLSGLVSLLLASISSLSYRSL